MSASNSSERPKKPDHRDYTVGWISALSLELSAAMLMLDEEHDPLACHAKDKNTYVFGRMGKHNIVIACLPEGSYGTISAASVAQDMVRSFGSIRFGLMVGIGAGIPSNQHQIRLGDIVVSTPTDIVGGVVQYDLGKTGGNGEFTRKGSLNKPPQVLLTAVAALKAKHRLGREKLGPLLKELQVEDFDNPEEFQHQGVEFDRLFQSDYLHPDNTDTCDSCDRSKVDPRPNDRPRPKNNEPAIHYGIIASGNQLIRHTALREQLRRDCNACCIEMEAAGLMDNFPCLVIRGICDYADSHKNDRWQQYAALTAAAYAKRLLSVISPEQVEVTPTVEDAVKRGQSQCLSLN
jgi:nucleoside phosphorylase